MNIGSEIFGKGFGFGALSGPTYGPYTIAFNTAVIANGGTLTTAEKTYLTTFETSIGADMAEFDRLWIHGLSNQIAAKVSFVNPTSTLITEVNSPTWTASQGFTGNGSTSYLNTNYVPSVDTNKFTLNSASYGVYQRIEQGGTVTGAAGAYSFVGGLANYTYLIPCYVGNNFYYNVNNITLDNYGTNSSSKGFYVANRTASLTTEAIKNGSVLFTGNVISSNLIYLYIFLLAINGGGGAVFHSSNQISLSFIGSGAINQSNFYNAVQTLGTSLGWAV